MHRSKIILAGLIFSLAVAFSVMAETFTLTDGKSVSGDIVSFNQKGVVLKFPDGKYSEPVAWEKFSQEDLKKLEEKLPKAVPLIEPLIVQTIEEKRAKTSIEVKKDFPKLERPAPGSLIGGLFSSALGIMIILVIYAANIYAGYEVAIFRAQQPALVCGLSAILPFVGPIIFLSMPTRVSKAKDEWSGVEQAGADGGQGAGEFTVPQEAAARQPYPPPAPDESALPPTQTFPRGQFTLNRRFFETKFPGLFGIIKRDADKDMILVIKSHRGTYVAQRIARIASNDIHVTVQRGHASEEVIIPFTEIQEVQFKHKDAP